MNSKTPVRLPFKAADPFIMRARDGRYYLYCTNEDGMGFPVRSSENLVDWKEHGLAFAAKDAKWGVKCFWAPECYEISGKYYLVATFGSEPLPVRSKISASALLYPTDLTADFRISAISRFLIRVIRLLMRTFIGRQGVFICIIRAAAMSMRLTGWRKAGFMALS